METAWASGFIHLFANQSAITETSYDNHATLSNERYFAKSQSKVIVFVCFIIIDNHQKLAWPADFSRRDEKTSVHSLLTGNMHIILIAKCHNGLKVKTIKLEME